MSRLLPKLITLLDKTETRNYNVDMSKLQRSKINYTRLDPALDEWFQNRADKGGQSKSYLLFLAARRFRDQVIRDEETEAHQDKGQNLAIMGAAWKDTR
jgi:hypothetical protein